jgi:hypothetical protein
VAGAWFGLHLRNLISASFLRAVRAISHELGEVPAGFETYEQIALQAGGDMSGFHTTAWCRKPAAAARPPRG